MLKEAGLQLTTVFIPLPSSHEIYLNDSGQRGDVADLFDGGEESGAVASHRLLQLLERQCLQRRVDIEPALDL